MRREHFAIQSRKGRAVNEDEWLSSTDPVAMLNHLGAAPNDRKCLLLVLAYLDRIWDFSVPGPIRE